MQIRTYGILAASSLLLIPVASHAAVTFEAVSLYSLAYVETADLEGNETLNYATGMNSAAVLPKQGLDAPSTIAGASDAAGLTQSSATDTEDVSATFSSAIAATFRASGTTTANVLSNGASAAAGFGYGNQAVYDFDIDKTAVLTVGYQIDQPEGALFGTYGYYSIQTIGPGSTPIASESFADNSGKIAVTLAPGDYGLLLIGGFTNDVVQQGPDTGVQSGSFDDLYTVNINTSGVPEPATWAILLAGFGAMGSALRAVKASRTVRHPR